MLGRETLDIPYFEAGTERRSHIKNWMTEFSHQGRVPRGKIHTLILILQKLSFACDSTQYIIHYKSMPCESRAHRELKENYIIEFSITTLNSHLDTTNY